MKIRKPGRKEKIELEMTPMIDIVFQLLIFFIMLFKIVLPEGDFNVSMPTPSNQPEQPPDTIPALVLRLTADDNGALTSLKLGDRTFADDGNSSAFDKLRGHIVGLVRGDGGAGTASEQEVELDCDYNLNYRHTFEAITAISGYFENGQRIKLIERIRFAPVKAE